MGDPLVLVVLVVALALGAAIGWRARTRRAAGSPRVVERSEVPVIDVTAIADGLPFPAVVVDGGTVAYRNRRAAEIAGLEFGAAAPVGDDGVALLGDPPRAFRVTAAAHGLVVLVEATEEVDFEEARRTFSAAVSHELRTPLARILGLAETLALPGADDEREQLVAQIEIEVDGIRTLIDEMLLLAALDRGRLAVAGGTVDASVLTRQVVEDARQRRSGRGRDVEASIEDGVEVPVAARLYEAVVQNLVDNALVHAGPDAAVRVELRRAGDAVVLTVADTGTGIEAQHLPHVFQRFYRGDPARTGPGTGLGLALVKHIVEAHGGAVAVESDGATGALFRVTLPVA